MKLLQSILVAAFVLVLCTGVYAFQRVANWYQPPEQSNEKAEFSWSRLSYASSMGSGGYGFGGGHGGSWAWDYPKADRQFLIALNRLTRIQGRSTEQVVSLDDDKIMNYPMVYAVQVQAWTFTDEEAKRMREYLLKGGFLMVDDFHGTADWENFMSGMRQIFPDRPVEDLTDKDEIFHVLYDMDDRFQRCRESSTSGRGGRMRKMAMCRSGAPSGMIKAASWWRSARICTWATRGSGPTIRSIRSSLPRWRSGWV